MILVLDNHDSFVHNLARYVRRCGHTTRVVRSDSIDAAGCAALQPMAIVMSPGPKRPEHAGCCLDVIKQLGSSVPILGVCLGHQAIGHALGASIVQVEPVHGRASQIAHDGGLLFDGCQSPMRVGRYHSLAIHPDTVPDELLVTARTTGHEAGMIMAVQHRLWPLFGVQFHPESVLTNGGDRLIANFLRIAEHWASPPFRALDHPQLVP
jgi:anthranilate synthase/aminodeoxychorismate synthase-like glutamine amidotransferase